MNEHPDRWLIIKITSDKGTLYKVFASWVGGYTSSDSWRMNSGITEAKMNGEYWDFTGYSGSVYHCHSLSYGATGWTGNVLQNFINKVSEIGGTIEVMPGTTDWSSLPYGELTE